MTPEAHLITWLEHLWQLYPAQGVIVVGAGNGSSPWIAALQRWNAHSVTLVEADDMQFQHLQHQLTIHEGWQLCQKVIAPESGSVTFHHASNPAESGLVEPENLRPLWPNLKTRQASTRQAISLAELLAETEHMANWLLLDCLPAGALLVGAGNALASCDVIVTRVLLPGAGPQLPAEQADTDIITQLLQAQGFRTVATQTSRHPGVAHTLHVRDRTAQLAQLNAELEEEREALQQARQNSQRVAQKTEATLAEHVAHSQALQHELASVQEQLAQITQAQATDKHALEYRDAKVKALQSELLQAKQSAQQAAEKADQMQLLLTVVQAEMAQWRVTADEACAEAEQAKAEANQAQAAFSQAIAERDGQLQALQGELSNAQRSAHQAAEQSAQLKQQVTALQVEAVQWREVAEKASVDAEQANHALEERAGKVLALQEELTKANQAAQQAMEKISQTQQQLVALQTKLDQVIAEREGLCKLQKDALAQVQALQQAKAELIKAGEAQSQAKLSEEKAKEEALAQAQVLALENKALKQKQKMVDEKIKDDEERYKKLLSNCNIISSEKDNLLLKVKDLTDIAADRLLKVGQLTEVIKGLK